jgi:hypothetical protein
LKKWRVTRIRAYKAKSASQHEYLSVAVADSHNKITYLAIERGRGDPGPIPSSDTNIDANIDPGNTVTNTIEPNEVFSSSNASLSSLSSVSNTISPARLAEDTISPIPASKLGMWRKGDELICDFTTFERPLYLYELAMLAHIVHEVNTAYLLMRNNCYHFAGTIMRMLKEEYNAVNAAEGAGAGTWCGIIIFSGKESNIASLLEKFKRCVKDLVNFVSI